MMSMVDLLVFATSFYTLYPGDILMTGTPQGAGPVKPGDTISASIELYRDHAGRRRSGLGRRLTNR